MWDLNRRNFLLGSATALYTPTVICAATKIDVEICLLFDCSGSMFNEDTMHFQVQKQGHIEALGLQAIQETWLPYRPLVSIYAWSEKVLPIFAMQLSKQEDFEILRVAISEKVTALSFIGSNTYHHEILHYFVENEKTTYRRVIDISTDEPPKPDEQPQCADLRDTLQATGTEVNVLSIDTSGKNTAILREYVVTQGGFALQISSFKDYKQGIADKMVQDLAV